MKFKAMISAALAAAVMATTAAMTASAVDVTAKDVIDYGDGAITYVWEALEIKASGDTVTAHLYDDMDSRYRITDAIVIPETINGVTVTGIDGFGFAESNIPSLTIPKTVKTIGNDFIAGCSKLTDIYFESSEAVWKTINDGKGVTVNSNVTVHFVDAASDNTPSTPDTPTTPESNSSDSTESSSSDVSASDTSSNSTSSDSSSSESASSDSSSGESTSSDTSSSGTSSSSASSSNDGGSKNDNPGTGAAGIALMFGAVIAGAAVVVSRKRK